MGADHLLLSFESLLFSPAHADVAAPGITIEAVPFAPRSAAAETPFTRLEAAEIGIDKPLEFSFQDMWPPFWEGRSLASGDIDRDGDIDLVIASTRQGLYLYNNDGAGQFTRRPEALGRFAGMPVFNAALADISNDGWPDLFVATYRQGNWVVPNRNGTFDFDTASEVANVPDAILSLALAFDDADADGDLDVAMGNWAAGWYRHIPGEEARNRVVFNTGKSLSDATFTDLPAIPGETLSILFSDIDGNGTADLIAGNDFEIPDAFYLGDGAGEFRMLTYQDGVIPHTTTTTMAIKSADLRNSGQMDLYFAQIAGRSSGVSETLKMQPLAQYCDTIRNPEAKALCVRNMQIKTWYKSGNRFDPTYASKCRTLDDEQQAQCKAMLVKDLAIQRNEASLCALISQQQPQARSFCEVHFLPARAITDGEKIASIPQVLRSNVLLEREDEVYVDNAEARGLHVGGWSWDTKIADFDNDGLQDVYIVNGTWVPNEVSPSNLFFHARADESYIEASGPFGLEDYLMTAVATAFDMDDDGDLDLVTHPVNGPIVVFRNNTQTGNAISLALDDGMGNRQGIGARVTVTLADGTQLAREVQIGGGFMSFDAPQVHFGLGDAAQAAHVQIRWRTGEVTEIDGPLPAGALYRIARAAR